jgi:hypothetical protein
MHAEEPLVTAQPDIPDRNNRLGRLEEILIKQVERFSGEKTKSKDGDILISK